MPLDEDCLEPDAESDPIFNYISGRLIWGVGQFGEPYNRDEVAKEWEVPASPFSGPCLSFMAGPEQEQEGYLSDCATCYVAMGELMKDIPGLTIEICENMHCIDRRAAEEELGKEISFDEIFEMLRDKMNKLGFVWLEGSLPQD